MATLEEGQCLVIGAVALGFISGLCAGGLFGVMIDEAVLHTKDLPTIRALDRYRDIITMLFSTLGFLIVIMSSIIGKILGYRAYGFLISIKGQQAKATALAGAAPVALLGITACGAAVGAICSKCVLEYGLVLTVCYTYYFFNFVCLGAFLASRNAKDSFADCALMIGTLGFTMYFLFLSDYLGFASVYLYYFLLFLFLYTFYLPTIFPFYSQNLSFVPAVSPILLLLFTLLFFVGTGTGTQSAAEKGQVIKVLAPQLLEAALGLSVFLHTGGGGAMGAGKVCAGAVAAGSAVLVAIQKASPMLNTGARLGGLIGVSGAAGVALSAAGALGQRYGEAATRVWGRKLGRTAAVLGAAAGAFLSGGTSDVRFGLFKAVCAAVISGIFCRL